MRTLFLSTVLCVISVTEASCNRYTVLLGASVLQTTGFANAERAMSEIVADRAVVVGAGMGGLAAGGQG
jgi:hypothetical protein